MHFDPAAFPGTKYFWETIRVFFSTMPKATCLILIGYVVLLIVVLIIGEWKERFFYIGSTLMLLITCVNPWMAWFLVNKLHFDDRYFRLFWLAPVVMLYIHMAVMIYRKAPKVGRIILWGLLMIFFGYSLWQISIRSEGLYHGGSGNKRMEIVDNIFKVEDDVAEACDIIDADSDTSKERRVIYDKDFYMEARAYDGSIVSILVPYFSYNGVDWDTAIEGKDWRGALRAIYTEKVGPCEKYPLDGDTLKLVMANARCDYVVLRKTSQYYNLWVDNFPVLGITEYYVVLKTLE